MKNTYTEEELEMLQSIENGEWRSIENGEWRSIENIDSERKRYQEYAATTLRKDKRVNIRISERDLRELQRKAVVEGIPYQTLISSLLHKYLNGRLIDLNAIEALRRSK